MKSINFIINGSKKSSAKLNAILDFFSNSPFFSKVEISLTQYPRHAEKIAKAHSFIFDYLIAVGGDGTLNEVINGVDLSSKTIVGLLPYGTGNDFSRGQNLKLDGQFLFDLIKNESYKEIYIGIIKNNFEDLTVNRRFINIADIGLGGFVTQKMINQKSKLLSGKLKYAIAILKGIVQYKKSEIVVEGDFNYRGKVLTLAICNSTHFGYGLCISPKADIQDKRLNITCIGNVSLWDYLKNLRKIKKGELIKHPEIEYSTIQNIKVYHTSIPIPIEVDGEFIGHTPVEIELHPKKLKFLLPKFKFPKNI